MKSLHLFLLCSVFCSAQGNDPELARRPPAPLQAVRLEQGPSTVPADHQAGTTIVTSTVVNRRWRNFGPYLQRLIGTVRLRWENILISGKIYPPAGSTVTVTFVLDAAGKIARMVNVDNKSSEPASAACLSAITDCAPYDPWTEGMIALLGKEQEITLIFYYQ